MQKALRLNKPSCKQTFVAGRRSRCRPQLPLQPWCWRGRWATSGPTTLHCNSDRPAFGSNDEEEVSRPAGSGPDPSGNDSSDGELVLRPYNDRETSPPHVSAGSALAGLAKEMLDSNSSASIESPSQGLVHLTRATSNPRAFGTIQGKGWYECNLFDVLQDAHIDAQSASHFFSQLAMHDSWASPLPLADLVTVARIADLTGFALPPIVAAQLQEMVMPAGPVAASASAEPLLAAFGYDFPVMLDVLYGIDVRPSHAWTDYTLRSWLAGGPLLVGDAPHDSSVAAGSSNAGCRQHGAVRSSNLTAASVRIVMLLLEAMYMPDAESWREPSPMPPPSPLLQSQPSAGATATGVAALQAISSDTWPSTSSSAASGDPAAAAAAAAALPYDTGSAAPIEAAHVRSWLDACIIALLSSGAVTRPHQREDLYGMLPQLATAPSTAVVERLYAEAPPPYAAAAGVADGDSGAGSASPEHLAALLWLLAKSGAKLPPSIIQRELRALEEAVIHHASLSVDKGPRGGSSSNGSSGSSSSQSKRPGAPGRGGRSGADTTPAGGAAAAATAAALSAAFALPSSPGASSAASSSPPQSTLPAAPSRSPPPSSSSSPSTSPVNPIPYFAASHSAAPLPPPPPPPPPPSPPSPFSFPYSSNSGRAAKRRSLSGRGAYLCFWAFHHHRHAPHAATAPGVAATLLAAVLDGSRELGAQQRCRVLRSLLLCFDPDSVHPRLMGSYDWSPLFEGWESLRAFELLPLLYDVAALARLRQVRRTTTTGDGGRGAQLHLANLAAHVVQLPGWPQRLEGAGLVDITSSIASLLAILAEEGNRRGGSEGRGSVGGGGGGGVLHSAFAQDLLRSWLAFVLPVMQERVKQATGDWGSSSLAGRSRPHDRDRVKPQQQQRFRNPYYDYEYEAHDNSASSPGGGVSWRVEPTAHTTGTRVVAATAAAADPDARGSAPWLPPGETPPPPAAPETPPLTAIELTAALTSLRDAAAVLDAAVHLKEHRALVWALQRLGSRAGRCALEPEAFGRVPDLLVQWDALAWVDVPTGWAEAVVRHPDLEATWFRSLPWTDALRAVLVSGQLLLRARIEVLRSHGAAIAPEPDADAVRSSLGLASLGSGDGGGSRDVAGSATPTARAGSFVVPSKAEAFLNSALRLRNHLVGLLAARIASGGPVQLRQLALTWQVYGMPYDREVLTVALGMLLQLERQEGTVQEGADSEVRHRQLRDAVQRLELMCAAQQAPPEEVERLFAAFRRPPQSPPAPSSAGVP